MQEKYLVIKTTADGVLYKKYKCTEGWSRNPFECWNFSKSGAESIAKRMNESVHPSMKMRVHFNTIEASKVIK